MTKDEIKKALMKCSVDTCKDCPYDNTGLYCCAKLKRDALDLITEQEKEIERLKAENDTNMQYIRMMGIQSHIKTSNEQVKQAKIDVLNELKVRHDYANMTMGYPWDISQEIDELIKEVKEQ